MMALPPVLPDPAWRATKRLGRDHWVRVLEFDGLHKSFGDHHVLDGGDLRRRPRLDVRLLRGQRRGQDDDDAHRHGAGPLSITSLIALGT